MLKRFAYLALLGITLVAPACSSSPSSDDMKDPNKDAEYKRNHRAAGYREAQSSQPVAPAQ